MRQNVSNLCSSFSYNNLHSNKLSLGSINIQQQQCLIHSCMFYIIWINELEHCSKYRMLWQWQTQTILHYITKQCYDYETTFIVIVAYSLFM